MKTKSLRIPDDLLEAISIVEEREHIERAPAIRKLIRMGLEVYVSDLYAQGRLTLREAAARLDLDVTATLDLLLERGVRGNLDAGDTLASIEQFV